MNSQTKRFYVLWVDDDGWQVSKHSTLSAARNRARKLNVYGSCEIVHLEEEITF